MPEIGEKVTVMLRWLGWRSSMIAFGVVIERLAHGDDHGAPMSGFLVDIGEGDGSTISLWEIDPDFVEGVGWCHGWEGPAVEALKVAHALT